MSSAGAFSAGAHPCSPSHIQPQSGSSCCRLQEPREPKDEHTQILLRIDDSSEAAQR